MGHLSTHPAGDGSLKKKVQEFYQFRLNLLIKISYIPDFEKVWSRDSKAIFFYQIWVENISCKHLSYF